jgi:hypothetical protein
MVRAYRLKRVLAISVAPSWRYEYADLQHRVHGVGAVAELERLLIV